MNPLRTRFRRPVIAIAITGLAVGLIVACRHGMFDRGALSAREHQVMLVGKPHFATNGTAGCPQAWVGTDGRKRVFLWPQQQVPAGNIQPDVDYTFTLLEPGFFGHGTTSLAKISIEGRVIYDASICQVHRETMHRTIVTVGSSRSTGLPDTMFPNCGRVADCDATDKDDKVTIWVCDSCRRERDRWLDKCRLSGTASL